MNKIDQIKAEIERLKIYAMSAKMEWIDYGYNQNAFAEDCRIVSFDELLAFIDSLPEDEPSSWKPSEEQMEALKYALGEGGKFDKAALNSLYSDLKKL